MRKNTALFSFFFLIFLFTYSSSITDGAKGKERYPDGYSRGKVEETVTNTIFAKGISTQRYPLLDLFLENHRDSPCLTREIYGSSKSNLFIQIYRDKESAQKIHLKNSEPEWIEGVIAVIELRRDPRNQWEYSFVRAEKLVWKVLKEIETEDLLNSIKVFDTK